MRWCALLTMGVVYVASLSPVYNKGRTRGHSCCKGADSSKLQYDAIERRRENLDQAKVAKKEKGAGVNTRQKGLGKKLLGDICNLIEGDQPPRDSKVKMLKELFEREYDNLYYVHVVAMLQRCARHKLDLSKTLPLYRIVEIINRNKNATYAPVEIAHALYGIRYYPQQSASMKDYLLAVIEQCIKCTDSFTGQEISNSLYGLHNFVPSPEIELLLEALSSKIKLSPHLFSGQEVSNCLYGLRKMTSESIHVKQIMSDLALKVASSSRQGDLYLNEQGTALSLNGLQGMSSEVAETMELLDSLLPLIKAGKEGNTFSDKIVGMSLMGLKCMSAEEGSVRELLRTLTLKIRASNTPYTAASLSSAIYGLRRMSDTVPEVVDIVLALTEKTKLSLSSPDYILDGRVISYILAGMQMMTGTSAATRELLAIIVQELEKNRTTMTDLEICTALCGLQSMSATECAEVKIIWAKLADQIGRNKRYSLKMEDLTFALYSLNNQRDDILEVMTLLRALHERIAASESMLPLSPKWLSMSMYGLRGMKSEAEETRLMLSFLQKKIPASLDPPAVGTVLYSMHRMSSVEDEVRGFIRAVTPRIIECQGQMSSKELANAFYGMMRMDSDHVEVVELVKALTPFLHVDGRRPHEPFTSQGVGNCISGFQTMTNSDPAISAALGHLADRVEECPFIMSPQDISNAIFGLQGMKADDENVRALVIALGDKLKECSGVFSARDISFCLTGLSSMDSDVHAEVADILAELSVKIAASEVKDEPALTVIAFGGGVRLKGAKRKHS